jgi:hypothetical protein
LLAAALKHVNLLPENLNIRQVLPSTLLGDSLKLLGENAYGKVMRVSTN